MKVLAFVVVLLVDGLAQVPAATESNLIVPVAQQRTVSASASVWDASGGDSEQQMDEALEFELFDSGAFAHAKLPTAWASCGAVQISEILADTIQATGESSSAVIITAPGGEAFASDSSELQVTFALAGASIFTLQGLLQAEEEGTAHLSLSGPGGLLFEAGAGFFDPPTVPVNESGTLAAGEYTLESSAEGSVAANDPIIELLAEGSFEFTFHVMPAAAAGPGGAVPDGSDVTGGPPLIVEKLSDDWVRLTWGASCRPDDDDFEVYEGLIGVPSSLLPVTCTTGGLLSHDLKPATNAASFLVVPTDGTTEGSYGNDSEGNERLPDPAACRPQALGDPICP